MSHTSKSLSYHLMVSVGTWRVTCGKELGVKAKMIGTTEVQTIGCENTDREAINFCHFLSKDG